jgi:hypothetical protein
VTAERAGSRRLPLVAVGTALVLVLAGAALALALSQGGGGHTDTGPGAGVGVLPTAPASAPHLSAAAAPRRRASTAGGWPRGLSAWTVVIATLAQHGHPRAAAERLARSASSPGLPATVLDSSQHPRLRPALWIVFAGRYPSRAQALRAARRVQAAGGHGAVVERLTG